MKIYLLLAQAQAKIVTIAKNNTATVKMKNGNEYSYDYVDLKSVIEIIKPVCEELGLSIVQSVEFGMLTTTIFCEDGSFVSSKCPAVANDKVYNGQVTPPTMQEIAGAITMARRYSLLNMFNIACSDDDASIASGVEATIVNKQAPRTTQAKPTNYAPQSNDLGDYVIQIGKKYKGQKLKMVDPEALREFINWLNSENKKKGTDASGATREFIEKAEAWLSKLKKEEPPDFNQDDNFIN
jgi:hypothetical protein